MKSRTRFIITAALLCHLLIAPTVVTSQLHSTSSDSAAPQLTPNSPSATQAEEVTMRALQQEKNGDIYTLRGQAEVRYRTYILYADEITYNSSTDEATAEGHVVLDGGPNDEHIEAARATYNVRATTGHFEHVSGTIGWRPHGTRKILTSSSPFAFTGKTVDKTGPDHYVVFDGTVTTCELNPPKWEFSAHHVIVDVGGNATLYRTSFRLGQVPILYLPVATHPVQREPRQSGFLIPSIGQSSVKGTVVGDSFFWAINRSLDLNSGIEYFSKRGWAPRGEFRARPSDASYLDFNYFAVADRGFGNPKVDQGGTNLRLDAEDTFRHNLRGVANIDYLTSYIFRLAFNEVFTQAVNSEVKSQAFVSNTTNGFSFDGSVRRYQNFESTANGDVVTILHAPSFESLTVDRSLLHTPLYWSYDADVGALSRSEPSFRTGNLVARIDLSPRISLPLHWGGWSIRPEVGLRETYYSEQQIPAGVGVSVKDPTSRQTAEGSIEVRPPALDRVFDKEWLGRKWKHVIEPRAVYRYVTGVNNFADILRFDDRDILSDTNEVEYALVNRLFAKRTSGTPEDCGPAGIRSTLGTPSWKNRVPWERDARPQQAPCEAGPTVREIVTWEVGQKYFLNTSFGGALVPGTRNVFTTTADLTGIAFLTDPRHLSPIVSRLKVQTSARSDAEWDLDYDIKKGMINSSMALMNYHFGQVTLGAGDAYLRTPGEPSSATSPFVIPRFNQFRLLLGYGGLNKRGFSGAANIGFDANLGFLQYASVQTTYNWDCCGVSIEYRRFALGSVRNENQFRFTFALANVGAFGNLRRQERLF